MLLMGGIYEVRSGDGLSWYDKHTKFYDERIRHSNNIKVITSQFQIGFSI
jgi:hypothetical protein